MDMNPVDLGGPLLATVAVVTVLVLLIPQPPLTEPGEAPPGNPQPGQPGGGGSPFNFGNPATAAALALVPAGLTPVAVFPPWARPRTVPAVAVIFSEDQTNAAINANAGKRRRKRRSGESHRYQHSPRPSSPVSRLIRRLRKNLLCLRARLQRQFGLGERPDSASAYFTSYHQPYEKFR